MLKETRNFVKEHKYEIIFGTGFVIVGAALIYCKQDENGTISGNSL